MLGRLHDACERPPWPTTPVLPRGQSASRGISPQPPAAAHAWLAFEYEKFRAEGDQATNLHARSPRTMRLRRRPAVCP
jgi:hypothetical protein